MNPFHLSPLWKRRDPYPPKTPFSAKVSEELSHVELTRDEVLVIIDELKTNKLIGLNGIHSRRLKYSKVKWLTTNSNVQLDAKIASQQEDYQM